MTNNKNTESSQGDGGQPAPAPKLDQNKSQGGGNSTIKSGFLFLSSKGIGWTSWKKRWFILTRTSLVFYRSDPCVVSQKGGEVNLTLGGIDLNNSGSVVVKPDKKLLTVSFPDGRDGRAFTLKVETVEDLNEWKTALETALAQAPSLGPVTEQNGINKNEQANGNDGSPNQLKELQAPRYLVIGRPILLALEDVDGSPSFLEKALRFIEEYGVNTEGILRQAASVDDVEHRIREYEQGKTEFSHDEDAHVIADCVKYFLRELPSSPVPASCCKALLEACRTDRANRVNAMREAILETFPEPNRRLLQRILIMMDVVASQKAKNRMSTSAVAACMAPLLLRPLLSGDCEIENDFDVGGDGSAQLLQAAAAANHAQAIVITLLEAYDSIFHEEGVISPGLYSDSDDYGSEDEELTEDDESYEDDVTEGSDYSDENEYSGSYSESGDSGDDDSDIKDDDDVTNSGLKALNGSKVEEKLSTPASKQASLPRGTERNEDVQSQSQISKSDELSGSVSKETNMESGSPSSTPPPSIQKSRTVENGPGSRRPTVWGRTSAKKNLSMESTDLPADELTDIQRLEEVKTNLQTQISEEVKGNEILQTNLEQKRKSLQDHRLALEKEVARLREELQKEREKRLYLEEQLDLTQRYSCVPNTIDGKKKVEVDDSQDRQFTLSQKFDNLAVRMNQHREENNTQENTKSHLRRSNRSKDNDVAAISDHLEASTNKDTGLREVERDRRFDRSATQAQQPDSISGSYSKPVSKSKTSIGRREEQTNQSANERQGLDKGRDRS